MTDPSAWKLPRLHIDREGGWFAEEGEITHPGILDNLRQNLCVDQDGHFLQAGPVRVPVDVEDTPFVVVRVEREDPGLILTLNDLTREALHPETLGMGEGQVPRCRVKNGRFDARFSRAATYQLLQLVEYDEQTGGGSLVLGDSRYPLAWD